MIIEKAWKCILEINNYIVGQIHLIVNFPHCLYLKKCIYYAALFSYFIIQLLSTTCMYLGAKIEEEPQKIRDVINVAYRLELSEN